MGWLAPGTTPMTLHVRLTKACNADCSYCSSWQENPHQYMRAHEYEQALRWMVDTLWPRLGLRVGFVTIEYIGGEILLVPPEELEALVETARRLFAERGITVHDGAQSNLLASRRRLSRLYALFEHRVSTSIDHHSGQRTVNGSAARYATFFRTSEQHLEEDFGVRATPAVVTLDEQTLPHTLEEVHEAARRGRNLTLRPAFQGGSPVNTVSPDALTEVFVPALRAWMLKLDIRIEPFASLLEKRLKAYLHSPDSQDDFCPHQANCAERSLSLEPDGGLYICQDSADAGELALGNALSGEFDYDFYEAVARRPVKLDSDCYRCDYFHACQGGCMLQSIQQGQGLWGKSAYCSTWKALFAEMDEQIEQAGAPAVRHWLAQLDGEAAA